MCDVRQIISVSGEEVDVHGTSSTEDDWGVCAIRKEGIVDETIYNLHIVEDSEWLRGIAGNNSSSRWEMNGFVVFHHVSV